MAIKRKTLVLFFIAIVLLGAAGWMVLVNPDNALTRLFSRKISDVEARIVIGPYPNDEDFRLLKANKIGLIVSLLNAEIPYEDVLLKQEKARAERFGLPLKNFPMSSVLGKRFGRSYDESAAGAAEAVAAFPGKVYLHCYLGMHRIQAVRDLLAKQGIESGTYTIRRGERGEASLLLDKAEAAFAEGRYAEALEALDKIEAKDRPPAAVILRGWCRYRLNQVPEAKAIFEAMLLDAPDNASANTGMGYCALRENDTARAELCFSKTLEKEPENPDALGGLGLALYRSGRIEEAARSLEASIKLVPNSELQGILDQIRKQQ